MPLDLAMGWRHLLFQSWPIDPERLEERLPAALSPDTYDGSAWLTVVPYTNVAVRPRGVPAAFGVALPELNLRTYVTCGDRSGVYFFSLDADGLASVLGARVLHGLAYYYARTSLEWVDGRVHFESRRRHPGARAATYRATYWPTGEPFEATTDDHARFLTERYRLFTEGPDGGVRTARIDHGPWTLYPADADVRENTLFAANGFERPEGDPVSYYSPGLDVVARASERVETGRRSG